MGPSSSSGGLGGGLQGTSLDLYQDFVRALQQQRRDIEKLTKENINLKHDLHELQSEHERQNQVIDVITKHGDRMQALARQQVKELSQNKPANPEVDLMEDEAARRRELTDLRKRSEIAETMLAQKQEEIDTLMSQSGRAQQMLRERDDQSEADESLVMDLWTPDTNELSRRLESTLSLGLTRRKGSSQQSRTLMNAFGSESRLLAAIVNPRGTGIQPILAGTATMSSLGALADRGIDDPAWSISTLNEILMSQGQGKLSADVGLLAFQRGGQVISVVGDTHSLLLHRGDGLELLKGNRGPLRLGAFPSFLSHAQPVSWQRGERLILVDRQLINHDAFGSESEGVAWLESSLQEPTQDQNNAADVAAHIARECQKVGYRGDPAAIVLENLE